MKIIVLANMALDVNKNALKELKKIATSYNIEILEENEKVKPDFYLTLGGDGSVLRAVHKIPYKYKAPIISIKTGFLGYLTCASVSEMKNALKTIIEGKYSLDKRSMLVAKIHKSDSSDVAECGPFHALNDIVALRSDTGRTSGFELFINEERVTEFLCDGIIAATPTGSTAYSLSAGGPILIPDTAATIINVICPHTLTSRPLIVSDKSKITIRISRAHAPVTFSFDGIVATSLNNDDYIEISKSSRYVELVKLEDYSPFDTLCKKLNWNQSSR